MISGSRFRLLAEISMTEPLETITSSAYNLSSCDMWLTLERDYGRVFRFRPPRRRK